MDLVSLNTIESEDKTQTRRQFCHFFCIFTQNGGKRLWCKISHDTIFSSAYIYILLSQHQSTIAPNYNRIKPLTWIPFNRRTKPKTVYVRKKFKVATLLLNINSITSVHPLFLTTTLTWNSMILLRRNSTPN